MMVVILGCSVIVVAFVLERVINLRRRKVVDTLCYDEMRDRLKAKDIPGAIEYARARPSPLARVLACVLECVNSPRAEIEAVIENSGARELWLLQRNAKVLGIMSNVAPLLGLLGTVFGIIRAFSDVAAQEGAIGNPRMLATGIYVALITTAAGLTVAIPSFLFYHLFRGRAEAFVHEIEERALTLMGAMIQAREGSGGGAE